MNRRNITVETLKTAHISELRELSRNPRLEVNRRRLELFRRLGLVRLGSLQADGLRKTWVLTDAGEELLAKAPDVQMPNIPKSQTPASGYWISEGKSR